MLEDFGEASEVYQYSGRQYDEQWQCPLKIYHAKSTNNSAA
jgi:FPC/CPF motif-containing protein YcgG